MQNIFFLLYIFLLFVTSCSDNVLPLRIITGEVSDITEEGAVFHAKITSLGNSQPTEFGFVWDTLPMLNINSSEKFSIQKNVSLGSFDAKISFSLIKDKKYYVRAFIRSIDDVSYGEEVSFVSLGGKIPEITSITPTSGNINDTLIIIGKYFSVRPTAVKINQFSASVIRSTQDSIFVRIPSDLNVKTSVVTLNNLNLHLMAKDSFSLIAPEISGFENKILTYGDEITIKGNNFLSSPLSLNVYFDTIKTSFMVIDNHTIKAVAPYNLDKPGSIRVVMNNLEAISTDKFALLPVEFYDFNPKTALTGSTITISGKNFSPVLHNNTVYIAGVKAKMLSATHNSLQVKLPLQDSVVYTSRNASVAVMVGEASYTHVETLLINDKWFRKADAPVKLYYQNCMVVDKTAYIGLYNTKEFWSYNTETNTWTKLPDFPGRARSSNSAFVYQDKLYFGVGTGGMTGYNTYEYFDDWWEFNTSKNTWTQKKNFPSKFAGSVGFSTVDGCYLPNGYSHTYDASTEIFTYSLKAWSYNPENDSWTNIELGKYVDSTKESMNFWYPFKGIENSSEVYINWGIRQEYRSTDKVLILNTKSKTSTRIADFPNNTNTTVLGFNLNGIVYLKRMDSSSYDKSAMYYYDKSTNKWKYVDFSIYDFINGGYGSFGFASGNLGYVGHSSSNRYLFEFDPNR